MAEHANVYPLRREPQPEPRPQEPLWREVLGRRLRALRQEQQETLSETAARAGISPQYLSEVERGRKEPSSEMIAALAGALGTTLIDLTEQVATDLRHRQALAPRTGPVMLSLAA
jgi:transcriptional regulator with XRE-family HTH domain